jgi:hypothetical protein
MRNSTTWTRNPVRFPKESIKNRLDHVEERISGNEDKGEELLHSDSNKEENKQLRQHQNLLKHIKDIKPTNL